MPKATQAEVEQRRTDVYRLVLAGKNRQEIRQYAAEKWQLSDRQARTYVQWATQRITEAAETTRAEQFDLALARLNDLYGNAIRLQDYRTALSVQKEITALLRLAPPIPSPAITLKTPADVLAILEGELNAVLTNATTPERTKAIQDLAGSVLKAMELSDLAVRFAALEERVTHE